MTGDRFYVSICVEDNDLSFNQLEMHSNISVDYNSSATMSIPRLNVSNSSGQFINNNCRTTDKYVFRDTNVSVIIPNKV